MLHWQGLVAPVMTVSIGGGTSTCLVLHTSLKQNRLKYQHNGKSELATYIKVLYASSIET